jgi:hypothetical protein
VQLLATQEGQNFTEVDSLLDITFVCLCLKRISTTMKLEAAVSSETLVPLFRTTWLHVSQECNFVVFVKIGKLTRFQQFSAFF